MCGSIGTINKKCLSFSIQPTVKVNNPFVFNGCRLESVLECAVTKFDIEHKSEIVFDLFEPRTIERKGRERTRIIIWTAWIKDTRQDIMYMHAYLCPHYKSLVIFVSMKRVGKLPGEKSCGISALTLHQRKNKGTYMENFLHLKLSPDCKTFVTSLTL